MPRPMQRPMPGRVEYPDAPSAKKPGLEQIRMDTVKRLLSYLGAYKLRLALVLVCIIISSVGSVATSLFIRPLIDDYIAPLLLQGDNPDYSGLLGMIGVMICVYATATFAGWFYNRSMSVITHNILNDVRCEMFSKLQRLPIRYFDARTHGEVMSHFTNDADTLRQMLSQSIPNIFSSIISLISVLISMLSLSFWLTLVALAFVALTLLVAGYLASHSGKYFVRQQHSLGKVNGFIEEMINGQRVVKVFCHEEKAQADFDKVNNALCHDATEASKYANMMMPAMMSMGYILYVLLAVVGGIFAIIQLPNLSFTGWGLIGIGTIAAFVQLSRSFIMPISQVSQQANSIIMAMAGASRIFDLMDEKPEEDEGTVTLVNALKDADGSIVESEKRTGMWAWRVPDEDGGAHYVELRGRVTMENVDFGYVDDKPVLHDITLYAEPGQKVAFVGATGAGKTTITNLINRFYDIHDGSIHYDGINIMDIRKADLRRSLGVVLQDVNLFTGTVMENIRYGKLDATDEECIAAAKLANAHGFIERLPQGYDTLLEGDGSGLSQGQRQLLSIARAAVADPPVMILDEATSSIDTRTEAIVARGMDALMEGRTVFVIAHRLSTVRNSDVIMVLEQGRIIERGDHNKLIAEKGQYYRLYTGAFELE